MSEHTKSQSFVSVITLLDAGPRGNAARVLDSLDALSRHLEERYEDHEIVLVANSRLPGALEARLGEVLARVPCIRCLQLAGNVQEDLAFAAGLENAIGDFLVMMRLDRDPVDIVGRAVELCKAGSDVVVGTAECRVSRLYRFLRPMANLLLEFADYRLPKNATHFRCLSRRAANAVLASSRFHHRLAMAIQNAGYPQTRLDYAMKGDQPGKSLPGAIHETLRLMVFNSSRPLHFVSMMGLATSGFACLVSLFALLVKVFKEDVAVGWASTVLVISFTSFVQFLILATISEYLMRLIVELREKDRYSVIHEKTSSAMLNMDRINVLEDSVNSDDINNVQTGRDR